MTIWGRQSQRIVAQASLNLMKTINILKVWYVLPSISGRKNDTPVFSPTMTGHASYMLYCHFRPLPGICHPGGQK